ncbi:DUF3440 domain-containing protein [Shewanella sp. D64]|uniref:DUF3440 domain-containing protein n=1 Tax=unclassified Shewanella TaxID=196818 RepID=UPI0022BA382E|nr:MULTISPECIES: DUF3440 domain-containing protein [unclassified Shewanella]MEC4729032.1 DUF3440 domain-containing protein [Shewanella sp. D64]MEC4739893.1 DUF3440 domain-containing protein [Shewanella sp. E94]WBJ97141.1 DUF3440 domain-containing protein [Shewanella sp. MTB7]
MKIKLHIDVYEASRKRIRTILVDCPHFYVAFSGGKDSGVLLNLIIEEARACGRLPVDVLIVDLEAQYQHTIDYITRVVERKEINAYWVCLPLSLRNAVSQFQPKWICWDHRITEQWIRSIPLHSSVISKHDYFPFYYFGMEFEEFVNEFAIWYQKQKNARCTCFIAIRSDESLNRFLTIKNKRKQTLYDYKWTTKVSEQVYNAYPIYDWHVTDIWTANGRFGWDYNIIYNLMALAGVSLSQQRLCQPFGDDQRKGLWLYQILEPHTWQKLVARVEGCNFGARYSKTQGRILGYYKFELPHGYTYKQYSKYLLNSMPPHLALHYRSRIFKFLIWWKHAAKKNGIRSIPDFADKKLESQKKVPSWRRICKVLIKNDYWCRGLSFGQNKKITNYNIELYNHFFKEQHEFNRKH